MKIATVSLRSEPLNAGENGDRRYHRRRSSSRPGHAQDGHLEAPAPVGGDRLGQPAEPLAPAHPDLAAVRVARELGPALRPRRAAASASASGCDDRVEEAGVEPRPSGS